MHRNKPKQDNRFGPWKPVHHRRPRRSTDEQRLEFECGHHGAEDETPQDVAPCEAQVVEARVLRHHAAPCQSHAEQGEQSRDLEDHGLLHGSRQALTLMKHPTSRSSNGPVPQRTMARLLLFGGKGGVGKTTCSAASAIRLADAGLRVLLVSSDPAHSTSDSLGLELGRNPRPSRAFGLFGLEMDPEARVARPCQN